MGSSRDVRLAPVGGEYMESATILEWLVSVGQSVERGQTMLLIETAKASVEIEAPAAGTVVSRTGQVGDEVEVGDLLAVLESDEDHEREPFDEVNRGGDFEDLSVTTVAPAPRKPDVGDSKERPKVTLQTSPRVRLLARELGIDLEALALETGKRRITTEDIDRYRKNSNGGSPGYSRAMAIAMAKSTEIPQFSVAVDCDGFEILRWRTQNKSDHGSATLNDLLICKTAAALQNHRDLLASWGTDRIDRKESIDIAVAISTPHGLVAPVIRSADALGIDEIAAETARLKIAARDRKLATEDLTGASFTLSNLGAFGIDDFTAIVRHGQSAILAISAFKMSPIGVNGEIKLRPTARFRLSADHRVVDGARVASFLSDLKARIENSNDQE